MDKTGRGWWIRLVGQRLVDKTGRHWWISLVVVDG